MHCLSPAAESFLDQKFHVHEYGFVRLVDYMGNDDRIVAAARVSYGAGTKTKLDDQKLIYYMMEHQHTSPFEQVVLLFHVKLPIFVARQWIRHRTARVNEMSGRFSELPEEFYIPPLERICTQGTVNKQGSAAPLEDEKASLVHSVLNLSAQGSFSAYHVALENDTARETARECLPLSTYTEWYWQIDLHNLFHFLQLRLDPHAQAEIRDYAKVMAEITKAVAPVAYGAFEEFVLKAVRLSGKERKQVEDALSLLTRNDRMATLDCDLETKLGL